ncbi:MAG: hypothetical protein VKI82_00720 [Leptolyngbya sp.]|nr:hypothetical protein [Leptolyngbya sp.]
MSSRYRPGQGFSPQPCIGYEEAHQRELADFQHLIDHLTADGRLARRDEEVILSALVAGESFSAGKCALFRQLQERVWRAEIYLEPETA